MKKISTQFKECKANGTAEIKDVPKNEVERIYLRPNSKGVEYMDIKKIIYCNKYGKTCSGNVCKKDRL